MWATIKANSPRVSGSSTMGGEESPSKGAGATFPLCPGHMNEVQLGDFGVLGVVRTSNLDKSASDHLYSVS